MGELIPFLFFLFFFAVFLRDEFIFTVLYIFLGLYLVGRWASIIAIRKVGFSREFSSRAFIGEDVAVRLQVFNQSWLPLTWLRLQDSLPVELAVAGSFKRIISLGSYGRYNYEYTIRTRKRGCYPVGPFTAKAGDLFGLGEDQQISGLPGTLIVYPKIYRLPGFNLLSKSPLGTLRTIQPIFEDPTRLRSKRDYVIGDSLRRIDWKATAAVGRLQTKQYEPSIALETMLYVNLAVEDFDLRMRIDGVELAITLAASISNWVVSCKQAVGITTNGVDPLSELNGESQRFQPLYPKKGQGHLMNLLDILARVESPKKTGLTFTEMLRREYNHLPWGTTVVLLTPQMEDDIFDLIFQMRRVGLTLVLFLVGANTQSERIRRLADTFDIPLYHVQNEMELSRWGLRAQ